MYVCMTVWPTQIYWIILNCGWKDEHYFDKWPFDTICFSGRQCAHTQAKCKVEPQKVKHTFLQMEGSSVRMDVHRSISSCCHLCHRAKGNVATFVPTKNALKKDNLVYAGDFVEGDGSIDQVHCTFSHRLTRMRNVTRMSVGQRLCSRDISDVST